MNVLAVEDRRVTGPADTMLMEPSTSMRWSLLTEYDANFALVTAASASFVVEITPSATLSAVTAPKPSLLASTASSASLNVVTASLASLAVETDSESDQVGGDRRTGAVRGPYRLLMSLRAVHAI